MASLERETPKHETVMDVTAEQIAQVYAQAFMGVAAASPNTAGLVDEVSSLVADVLDRFAAFDATLRSALVSQDEKEKVIDRVFGPRASAVVLNFLKVVSRHGRLELLRPIARILRQLQAARSGLTDVEVRTAAPLDDALLNVIRERLQRALGTQPVLHMTTDPSLIAGIWVRVGDRVFDGSIRTQLEHARRRMIELATEKIETEPQRFVQTTA